MNATITAPPAEAIATLGYIYGYPLVLMDATRATMTSTTPVNRFDHKHAFPDETSAMNCALRTTPL